MLRELDNQFDLEIRGVDVDRLRDMLTGKLEVQPMAKTKAAKAKDVALHVRIPVSLRDEMDQIAELLSEHPDTSAFAVGGTINRATVMRLAMQEGAKVLRRKYKR